MRRKPPIAIWVFFAVGALLLAKVPAFASLVQNIIGSTADKTLSIPLDEFPISNGGGATSPGSEVSTTAAVTSPTSTTAPPTTVAVTTPVSLFDPSAPSLTPEIDRAAATKLIDQLRTAGRGPKTGYSRDAFGSSWTDANGQLWGRNGCDTRNDILRRDLNPKEFKAGSDCKIVSGVLAVDPYTGTTINWQLGADSIDIEHLWPLSLAWQMGAARWSETRRTDLANDPLNLFAADSGENRARGDSSPASWLPKNKAVRCTWAGRFAAVALKYDIPVTEADKEMLTKQCAPPSS